MHFDDVSNDGDSFFSAIAHFQSKIGGICPSCKKISAVFHMNIFSFLMKILFFNSATPYTPRRHFHQTACICFVRYDNPRFAACAIISPLPRKKASFSSLFSQKCLYLYIYTLHSRIDRHPSHPKKTKNARDKPSCPLRFLTFYCQNKLFSSIFPCFCKSFLTLQKSKTGIFRYHSPRFRRPT